MKGLRTRNSATAGFASPALGKKAKSSEEILSDVDESESKSETESASSSSSLFHMGVVESPSIEEEDMEILKKVRHDFSRSMDFDQMAKNIKTEGVENTCRIYVIGNVRRVFFKTPHEEWSKGGRTNKFAVILENGTVEQFNWIAERMKNPIKTDYSRSILLWFFADKTKQPDAYVKVLDRSAKFEVDVEEGDKLVIRLFPYSNNKFRCWHIFNVRLLETGKKDKEISYFIDNDPPL